MTFPAPRLALWRRAWLGGYAGTLADAVVAQRDMPDDLYVALHVPFHLSPRQTEVLLLGSCGWRDRHIAAALACSTWTVQEHWQRIYRRLGVERGGSDPRTIAVARGIRSGLI